MSCVGTANNPLIRGEDYTALTGDIFVTCTGGIPTVAGQQVPKVDITVFTATTSITSKLTDTSVSPAFNEALLVIDEAGSVGSASGILNCGNTAGGAPYSASTPLTCDILGTGGITTYDGLSGHPNVFQGRQVSTSAGTAIQFLGVPLDPGGPNNSGGFNNRTLRLTNIRVDATKLGIFGGGAFTNAFINTTVTFNGTNFGGSQFISVVNGTVRGGIVIGSASVSEPANFLQCTATAGLAKKSLTITEGFATAFKVRNWSQIQLNGIPPAGPAGWIYDAALNATATPDWNATDVNQNVPNALYNTESGFMYPATLANPVPGNPPPGTGPSGAAPVGTPLVNSPGGIALAGTVTQGTRIAVRFGTAPVGSNPTFPNIVTLTSNNIPTGAMALVTGSDANGAGGTPVTTSGSTPVASAAGGVAVYEVLFSTSGAIETATITISVAPKVDLTASPATPEIASFTASAGFAPFYAASTGAGTASLMTSTLITTGSGSSAVTSFPIPRFIDSLQGPVTLYDYSRCACDLLFPWVVGDSTFTTSIVVANTSLDPCAGGSSCTAGFSAKPQAGKVTFWYFGTTGISLDPATPISTQASQTSTSSVPAGSYLAHIISPSAAGTTVANGLVKLAANFAGYVIAQAQFQYCHGVASISANVPGFGTQTYIGLTLDTTGSQLPRTTQTQQDGLVH
jgi:hypothetical protein